LLEVYWAEMNIGNKISTRVTSLKELIILYERSNRAEGKSEKTICWYSEILALLCRYFRENGLGIDISNFNINTARDYILYLRNKPKYEGHPFAPKQNIPLSP